MHEHWPDERFRELTRDLLDAIADDELADAIVQHVVLRASDDVADRAAVVRAMPSGVRAIYTTWLVDAEVCNGGFNQLFWNPSGEFAGDALAGYEPMGAEEYAAVMRGALATWETERGPLARFHAEGTLEAFRRRTRTPPSVRRTAATTPSMTPFATSGPASRVHARSCSSGREPGYDIDMSPGD